MLQQLGQPDRPDNVTGTRAYAMEQGALHTVRHYTLIARII